MDDLTSRILRAQESSTEMARLLADYTPLIRQEASKVHVPGMEQEDRASVAMLVFMNCVRQYAPARGGFIGFARLCIRNRLLDESARAGRREGIILPMTASGGAEVSLPEARAAQDAYDREAERQALAEEIDALAAALAPYGIAFAGLAEASPRQRRSRALCMRAAGAIAEDEGLREMLLARRRVPQRVLAERLRVSEKTIEKHRKYIVTLALVLMGDYPGIRAFLPEGDGEA